MEKPGWGVVAVIVAGIAVLAFFLIFPDQEWKKTMKFGQDSSGTPTFGDAQTMDKARDSMKVVDGTESKAEIVRGSADPVAGLEYDPAGGLVRGGNTAQSVLDSSDNPLAGYLDSLASEAPPASLFASIQSGDFSTVQSLLDDGADVAQRDEAQNSALHLAATQGSVELGSFLIRYGAEVNTVNGDGKTPLDLARLAKNTGFEQLLLAYGAREGTASEVAPVSPPE